MIKLFAFDFDGTLADSFELISKCFEQVFTDLHVKLSKEDLRKYYGTSEDGMCDRMMEGQAEEGFKDYLKYYDLYHDDVVPPLDEKLRNLLMLIKDSPCHLVLLTGRHQASCDISFSKMGLEGVFEKVYVGNREYVNKPDNFKQVMSDFNLKPNEICYIGDSLRDVESCKKAGVNLISVNYYHTCDREKLTALNPFNVCYTIDELVGKVVSILNQ